MHWVVSPALSGLAAGKRQAATISSCFATYWLHLQAHMTSDMVDADSMGATRCHSCLPGVQWDETIRIDDHRLAPPGSRVYQEGGPLRTGQRVEAVDELGKVRWER